MIAGRGRGRGHVVVVVGVVCCCGLVVGADPNELPVWSQVKRRLLSPARMGVCRGHSLSNFADRPCIRPFLNPCA